MQDNFVEMGGVRTLSALLHSKSARVIYQCATALSYIVSDSEENKSAVVADHGSVLGHGGKTLAPASLAKIHNVVSYI